MRATLQNKCHRSSVCADNARQILMNLSAAGLICYLPEHNRPFRKIKFDTVHCRLNQIEVKTPQLMITDLFDRQGFIQIGRVVS
jgi:hypothetical protein